MKYLELEQLEINEYYNCETYDGNYIIAQYVGDGDFLKGRTYYSVYGTIRYVFNKVIP